MSSPGKKRFRQDAGNESQAKRLKTESTLEDLHVQVKQETHLLDDAFTLVLGLLPTHDSAKSAKDYISTRKARLGDIMNNGQVSRQTTAVFEINLGTVFTGEIASQVEPCE